MALHWDLTKVRDTDTLHNTGEDAAPKDSTHDLVGNAEWTITNTLIWKTLAIGLNEITEANVDEWVFRCNLADLIDGPMKMGTGAGFFITRQHIERRIGLRWPHERRTQQASSASGDERSASGQGGDRRDHRRPRHPDA